MRKPLSLIKLDPSDYGKVNPSVPTLGGPDVTLANGTEAFTGSIVG